jgi:hypothetical protein
LGQVKELDRSTARLQLRVFTQSGNDRIVSEGPVHHRSMQKGRRRAYQVPSCSETQSRRPEEPVVGGIPRRTRIEHWIQEEEKQIS